jgi:GT2 family glycosyltransferase
VAAATARNLGAHLARGDDLLFLDADCVAAPDLLERLLERRRQGQSVVGGSVDLELGDYWRLCDNLLAFTPFLASTAPGPRPYLPSLNLSLRRALFLEVGGFDEHYPGAAGEDLDLSMRLRERGHTLFFEPGARVFHRPPRTTARSVARHLRAYGRAHLTVQRDHQGRAAPRLSPRLRPWAGLIMAAAPVLALADGLALLGRNPPLRRHWPCLPGIAWGKAAWYWGVAEGMLARPEA